MARKPSGPPVGPLPFPGPVGAPLPSLGNVQQATGLNVAPPKKPVNPIGPRPKAPVPTGKPSGPLNPSALRMTRAPNPRARGGRR